jgi:hypothetical protein
MRAAGGERRMRSPGRLCGVTQRYSSGVVSVEDAMPAQNPITRVEQVALDLGRLAEELGDYAGPNARRTLIHWRAELLAAIRDLQAASSAGLAKN